MGKPKSLADRIAEIKTGNRTSEEIKKEQAILDGLKGEKTTGSGLGQVKVRSLSGQGQVRVKSGSSRDMTLVKSGSGQVSGSGSGSGQVSLITPTVELAPKQKLVYEWFINNGLSGSFNKGQIQRETGINHPTIRKCIAKLELLKLIELGIFSPVSKQQIYRLNCDKNVYSGSSIGSGSGQGQVRVRSRST